MGAFEEMSQNPAVYWSHPARYPEVVGYPELSMDTGYRDEVIDTYGAFMADNTTLRYDTTTGYLPSDVYLVRSVEDFWYRGRRDPLKAILSEQGVNVVTAPRDFNLLAEQAKEMSFYGGGAGASIIIPGLSGWAHLFQRRSAYFVPEVDGDGEPTGQLVGLPSEQLPSGYRQGERFNPDAIIDPAELAALEAKEAAQSLKAPLAVWTGNLVVPSLVEIGKAHSYASGRPGVSCRRKVILMESFIASASSGQTHLKQPIR